MIGIWRSAIAIFMGFSGIAIAEPCADLALVLSVDSSGSIDDPEFALQVRGFADAFRHPAVLDAMAATGRVDVAAVFWGGPSAPVQIVPWQSVESRADAAHFATRLAATSRHTHGSTGLGKGVIAALNLLADPSRCDRRAVINVSGDGKANTADAVQRHAPAGATNQETLLAHAQWLAVKRGVTINGLAIVDDEPDLTAYYRQRVITGPGSFVMETTSRDDFAEAVIRKLRREILPMVSARSTAGDPHAPGG